MEEIRRSFDRLRMTALVVGNALCKDDPQFKRKDKRTVPLSSQQYREFGVEYVLNNRKRFELEAYEKEEAFIQILKERGVL
ncbi:MAG: hypothetical protein IJE70_02855 [Oscillospiraceae bacterium]|nr:hypothetical protein [Oscillospiraceae bacterium]